MAVFLVMVFLFGVVLAACSTIKGVGRDIEAAGEAIGDTVDGD